MTENPALSSSSAAVYMGFVSACDLAEHSLDVSHLAKYAIADVSSSPIKTVFRLRTGPGLGCLFFLKKIRAVSSRTGYRTKLSKPQRYDCILGANRFVCLYGMV